MKRIFVDEMLRDVSKWLRLLGIKNFYLKGKSNDYKAELILHSKNSFLVTSNKLLVQRIKHNVVFLDIKKPLRYKLCYVLSTLNLHPNLNNKLCTLCNSTLSRISKKEVKGKVFDKVYANNNVFYFCKNCNKYYWEGRHWKRVQEVYNFLKSKCNS